VFDFNGSEIAAGVEAAMGSAVVDLPQGREREAACVLAAAFQDDPLFTAFIPDPRRRARALPIAFRAIVTGHAAVGRVLCMSTMDAVSVWEAPRGSYGPLAMLRAMRTLPLVVGGLTPGEVGRWMSVMRQFSRGRAEVAPEKCWSLSAVGVRPERQNLGYGVIVLRPMLRLADEQHLPIYLETENPRNEALYIKLGFRTVAHIDPAHGPLGVPMWRMLRDPLDEGKAR
jgi:GNAT superfamily N-acetyltransferase